MRKEIILFWVVIFGLGNRLYGTPTDTIRTKEIRKGIDKLTNPLLDCFDIKKSSIRQMKDIETKIKQLATAYEKLDEKNEVSIYYRNLNNGPWIGVKEELPYSPASLLKVPIMMVAYKIAEEDPSFLSKKIKYTSDRFTMSQNIIDSSFSLTNGQEYTLDELINFMIIYSDNQAMQLVQDQLTKEQFREIFYELGIDIKKYRSTDDFLNTKDYATFFRLLYNATFLNVKYSNKALLLLSKSTYIDGIVAGVPTDVIVAHKFGEREMPNNTRQLHDCGIVYKQQSPYLVCIMARGTEIKKMEMIIQKISALLYHL